MGISGSPNFCMPERSFTVLNWKYRDKEVTGNVDPENYGSGKFRAIL